MQSAASAVLSRTISSRTLALFRPLRFGAAVFAYSTRIPNSTARALNPAAWAVVTAAAGSAATYYLYLPRGPNGAVEEIDSEDLTKRIQFPITQAELDEFLRKDQVFYVPPAEVLSAVVRVDVDLLESNNPIEDRYTANVIAPNGHASLVFGVLDGHWDATCADVVTKALPAYVSRSIAERLKNDHVKDIRSERIDRIRTAITAAFEDLDRDLMNLPLIAIPNFEKLTPEEIVRLPDEVRRRARDAIVPALTGTCAVLSYIDGDDLYVAHAGDSRAILGVQTPTGLQALELTRDHQPSNPDELARLKQEHPGEENTVAYRRGNAGPLRVIGGMMPTRAFGDAKFKWPLEWHAKVDALLASVHPPHKHVFTTSKHCFTPPYMTARPDIVHRHLTEEDSFIVLASDGIFDYLSNDDVVGAVDQYLQAALTSSILSSPSTVVPAHAPSPPSQTKTKLLPVVRDTNAATHVVRTALSHGKGDKEAARMLSLSSDERRNWRDDMTVVVIFLRGSAVTQASSAGIPAVSSATVASTSKEMGKVEGAGGLEAVVDVNVDFGIPRVVEHLGNEKVVVGEHLQGR